MRDFDASFSNSRRIFVSGFGVGVLKGPKTSPPDRESGFSGIP